MLAAAFKKDGADYLAVIEDDMFPGGDMALHFGWASKVMEADPSVFSVSGHNENAKTGLHLAPEVFVRASHFVGLGWMLSKRVRTHAPWAVPKRQDQVPGRPTVGLVHGLGAQKERGSLFLSFTATLRPRPLQHRQARETCRPGA